MKAYIGIDPGKSGSICLLDTSGHIEFIDMATPPSDIFSKLKSFEYVYDLAPIMIEKVRNIQGTSSASNFVFGYNVGWINGIIRSTGIGVDEVTPVVWQKKLQIPVSAKGKFKKIAVKDKVISLYPDAEIFGARGGLLDGRSDALAITHYSRLLYG